MLPRKLNLNKIFITFSTNEFYPIFFHFSLLLPRDSKFTSFFEISLHTNDQIKSNLLMFEPTYDILDPISPPYGPIDTRAWRCAEIQACATSKLS